MINLSDFKISKIDLTQKIAFDCGDTDLNDFFITDSQEYQKSLLANTYCIKENTESNKIVAMVSLSNDSISLPDEIRKNTYNKRKILKSYPTVKIGRLGVHKDYQSKKLGLQIINFLKVFFIVRNKTGCRYITVDAYNKDRVLNFYKSTGMNLLTEKDVNRRTRTMYFDLLPVYNKIQEHSPLVDLIEKTIKEVV